ncbi:MAG: cytochrome c [Gemmatimonadaceae bacterium]|nr:cytochrome c [Gemmatimonadaceae bacterium]MCW5826173.1 cytochrome c [Gemmatimonadaceae bacterium]
MRVSLLRWSPVFLMLLAACGGSTATTSAAGAAPQAARVPSPELLASIARGDSLFNAGSCQRCHGQKGVGAQNGPSLIEGQWLHVDGSQVDIARVITAGIAREAFKVPERPFAMRPRGGPMNLTDEQVQDVAAYVVSISRGKTAR